MSLSGHLSIYQSSQGTLFSDYLDSYFFIQMSNTINTIYAQYAYIHVDAIQHFRTNPDKADAIFIFQPLHLSRRPFRTAILIGSNILSQQREYTRKLYLYTRIHTRIHTRILLIYTPKLQKYANKIRTPILYQYTRI